MSPQVDSPITTGARVGGALSQISFCLYLLHENLADSIPATLQTLEKHTTDVDEILRVADENVTTMNVDIAQRLAYFRIPLETPSVFKWMVYSPEARDELLNRAMKAERVLHLSQEVLQNWGGDTPKAITAVKDLAHYMIDLEARWTHADPEVVKLYNGLARKVENWNKQLQKLEKEGALLTENRTTLRKSTVKVLSETERILAQQTDKVLSQPKASRRVFSKRCAFASKQTQSSTSFIEDYSEGAVKGISGYRKSTSEDYSSFTKHHSFKADQTYKPYSKHAPKQEKSYKPYRPHAVKATTTKPKEDMILLAEYTFPKRTSVDSLPCSPTSSPKTHGRKRSPSKESIFRRGIRHILPCGTTKNLAEAVSRGPSVSSYNSYSAPICERVLDAPRVVKTPKLEPAPKSILKKSPGSPTLSFWSPDSMSPPLSPERCKHNRAFSTASYTSVAVTEIERPSSPTPSSRSAISTKSTKSFKEATHSFFHRHRPHHHHDDYTYNTSPSPKKLRKRSIEQQRALAQASRPLSLLSTSEDIPDIWTRPPTPPPEDSRHRRNASFNNIKQELHDSCYMPPRSLIELLAEQSAGWGSPDMIATPPSSPPSTLRGGKRRRTSSISIPDGMKMRFTNGKPAPAGLLETKAVRLVLPQDAKSPDDGPNEYFVAELMGSVPIMA